MLTAVDFFKVVYIKMKGKENQNIFHLKKQDKYLFHLTI